VRAFAYLNGIVRRFVYDNLKPAGAADYDHLLLAEGGATWVTWRARRWSVSTAGNSSSGAFVREYPALCRHARDSGQPHEEFLRELLEAEVTSRRQSTGGFLREARFPDIKPSTRWIGWRSKASRSRRSSNSVGVFNVSPASLQDVALTALSAWSATDGLTMLAIDNIARADLSIDDMISRLSGHWALGNCKLAVGIFAAIGIWRLLIGDDGDSIVPAIG
jgi:hypothetical protein